MWEVTKLFKGKLPKGFSLWEDPALVVLKKGKKIVARFLPPVTPEVIEKAAKEYLEALKKNKKK
jgi:hypothetical protein